MKSLIAEGSGFKSSFVPIFFYLLSFFLSRFWLVLFAYLFFCFSINMYLNNCYLIKCNKQKEKYCVSIEDSILNILYMDKQSEFLSFPTIYCGKPELITTWSCSKQRFHELTFFLSFFLVKKFFMILCNGSMKI